MATKKKTSSKSTKKSSSKKRSATKAPAKSRKTTKRRSASKRTLIEPHKGDRRYVRRNKEGEFKTEVNVGRSLAADRRRKSKTKAGKGQGDRGDASSGGIIESVRNILKKI